MELNQQLDGPIINSEMIYDVYVQGDLIAETDSVDLVKVFIKENPGCSVRDALSGKEFTIKYAAKSTPKSQAIPAGGNALAAGGDALAVTER